ncbi:MAG: dephospho-CoA kinase [Dehalococcoidia bacterium]|nr:dephospho-CoA kinase [Dehalococcoidia bacterium]
MIAGITGTIGTGKSTVSAIFAELGAYVIDWDRLGHEVVQPGKSAWKQIVESFGKDILSEDQTLNRQKMAQVVFNNPEKLKQLNSIVHPAISNEDRRLVEERTKLDPKGLIVKDIPLLLEGGPELARLIVDKIIVIYCSPEVQFKRLISRGMSEQDAHSRIKNQIPVAEKIKHADYVINNDGLIEETKQQVKKIYSQLVDNQQS